MHKFRRVVLALVIGTLVVTQVSCITIPLFPPEGPLQERTVSGSGNQKILLVEMSGLISSEDPSGFIPRPSLIAHIKEVLTVAKEDPDVKALVIKINSPGGSVSASDVLYHELKTFKATRNIPVIASIMDIGTSGGYYIAAAADKIVAYPSSVTGSLGVIMLTVNAGGLLEKIGVEATAITSGPRKDMGSPFRAMTAEERAIFQGVIDAFYKQFLEVIDQGRPNLSMEEIRRLADGRIYTGPQAKALGLVDEIGYLEDAITLAKQEAGLTTAKVVTYGRPGEYQHNIYSNFLGREPGPWTDFAHVELLNMIRGGTPKFMYLWMP